MPIRGDLRRGHHVHDHDDPREDDCHECRYRGHLRDSVRAVSG